MLSEDAKEIAEYVSQALKKSAKDVTILLYAPRSDPYFEELTRNIDRFFYFEEGPKAAARRAIKGHPHEQKSRTTPQVF